MQVRRYARRVSTSVAEFLRIEAGRAGSLVALARLFGISRQRLDDAMRGGFRIGFKPCLRFAVATDRDPVDVLQALGHGDLASLLRQCYGPKTQQLRPTQVDVLRLWERLPSEDRPAVRTILTRLASEPPRKATKPRKA